ncbi:hypothetical protein BDP55DRAFT_677839 [Colletotrichum godetiae]|uniref:Uncharacterized protein n=1 Tax=Colletotrichum godetiae TaxID=1209918 RepID=A0AAJ0AB95_9PEZI|nr:uncharacterized protein BDP55DRAFT_677839 [Colletotrichum godetiae]KAK1659952.1 hypothetical protein BDP55DRAFT_677839 [Colletotrichum godetiae]
MPQLQLGTVMLTVTLIYYQARGVSIFHVQVTKPRLTRPKPSIPSSRTSRSHPFEVCIPLTLTNHPSLTPDSPILFQHLSRVQPITSLFDQDQNEMNDKVPRSQHGKGVSHSNQIS